ncbi:MAG: hypothetical protein QXR89_06585 [Candidatus Bathyarchaeia archaeon]
MFLIRPAFAVIYIDYGVADVRVYVVMLDGVDAHGVNNVSRAVKGVLEAANQSTITWPRFPGGPLVPYGRALLNVECLLVNSWDWYRDIVEVGSNIVIVNIHGETIPIPRGYSKEGWVDKIAEAMIYRNITWVHTVGYPFYYYQSQSGEWAEWGEEGFKRLMAHMGKENVTCRPPGYPDVKIYLSLGNEFGDNWVYLLSHAFFAERGNPLNGSMFSDCSLREIWGVRDGYLTGAVLRFNKPDNPKSFGFYVHIGTRKTFNPDGGETDGDFVRAYVGAAAAIYMNAYKQIVEQQISRAEEAIRRAESEGRTKGLSEAKQLLAGAIEHFNRLGSISIIMSDFVEPAIKTATKAEKPSFVETYAKHLTILGIIGLLTASMIIKRVRNKMRNLR